MILVKILLPILLNIILSVLLGFILVPILKKFKLNQSLSIYLSDRHKSKVGTPTMGGLIFIIPVVITNLIFIKKININLIIVLITFIGYSLIGFIDDYLIIKNKNNSGLSETLKFLLQVIVAIIFFYLFMISGNEPLLWIHLLHIKLNIGFLYGIIILLVLVSSSNAVNITDGLDGLAGSLSLISFMTLGIICMFTGWLDGYVEISLFCFSLVGSLIGFLLFNMYPAKIFMGDTGSLALGGAMGAIAILTRHELLLILIGFVFVVETLTCIIQRIYYKFTKKRLFLMTPIHHSFEKRGYKEIDIVKFFCLVGLMFGLISIIIGVIL